MQLSDFEDDASSHGIEQNSQIDSNYYTNKTENREKRMLGLSGEIKSKEKLRQYNPNSDQLNQPLVIK